MDSLERFNQVDRDMDTLYHAYARSMALSDSAMCALYDIYFSDCVTTASLAKTWGLPCQTAHSSLKKLEKEGLLEFQPLEGSRKEKQIFLSEKGKQICREKIVPLKEIEQKAAAHLSGPEQEQLCTLFEKYRDALREEMRNAGVKVREEKPCR